MTRLSDEERPLTEALDFYRDRCHDYGEAGRHEQYGDGSPAATDHIGDRESAARAEVDRLIAAALRSQPIQEPRPTGYARLMSDVALWGDVIKFVRWSANVRNDTAEAIAVAKALNKRIEVSNVEAAATIDAALRAPVEPRPDLREAALREAVGAFFDGRRRRAPAAEMLRLLANLADVFNGPQPTRNPGRYRAALATPVPADDTP